MSSPAPPLSHEPTITGALGVCTSDTRAPAPQPPKVANGCGSSRTAAASPRQVLHRVLEWAPAGAPPTRSSADPRGAATSHFAWKAVGDTGVTSTSREPPPGSSTVSRGREADPSGARDPTSRSSPHGVTTTGSSPARQRHVGGGHRGPPATPHPSRNPTTPRTPTRRRPPRPAAPRRTASPTTAGTGRARSSGRSHVDRQADGDGVAEVDVLAARTSWRSGTMYPPSLGHSEVAHRRPPAARSPGSSPSRR